MGLQCRQLAFNGKQYDHYFLCNYRPLRAGADAMSQSLIRFKQGWKLHVDAWCDCAVQELVKHGIGTKGFILRAGSSVESNSRQIADSPLSVLCQRLSDAGDARYNEHMLVKTRETLPLKALSWHERVRELEHVYHVTAADLKILAQDKVLLVDDIYTSGATMRAILHALLVHKRSPDIKFFTLAYTDHDADLNRKNLLTSSHYQFSPDIGWSAVAEEKVSDWSGEELKHKILRDDFS